MATNLFRGSCTPNLGGVQDYYTKAEINQLFRRQGGPETLFLETGHVWVGNLSNVQGQYQLDPNYYTVDYSAGTVVNLSADRLRTARTLSLTGVVTGTASSDLATGFTINTTVALGAITGAMIGTGAITNTNISSTAEIAVSKLADGNPRQLLETADDGTTVQWATNIDVPGTLDVTGNAVFDANVNISGNLTVSGTQTILDVETLRVEDRNIELGKVATPTDITADGGGITLLGDTGKTILWERATASWSLSEHLNIASGRSYRINNIPVLSATALGASVQISTDNIPADTVTNEDLAGGIVDTKLNTIVTANKVAISALDIDGGIDIGAALADTDLFVVDDGGGGTNRKAVATRITDYVFGKVSGDITVSSGGTAAITAGVVIDGDISPTAEIAVSKLADGTPRQLLETAADGTTVQWATNIDVPGTLDVTGIATFDTKISIGVAEPTAVREIGWNTDGGTYEILLDSNVLHHLGADQTTLCRNNSNTVAIPKGTAVMFAGTVGNSGRLKVAPMVADGTYPGYVFFGVTESIVPGGGDGYVKSFGEIRGLDTNAYPEQSILWCDPANPGGFTATEPAAPNLKLSVASVISSANNGVLMIRWDTGNRLKDLHDVEVVGTPLNGDILKYNTSLSRWENTQPVFDGPAESARDIEESRLIRRNATVSIGTPGTVPFGVGPIIPPGMSLVGIGADAYNVIDIYSGSVC